MPWVEKRGRASIVRWVTIDADGKSITHASGRLTAPKAEALVEKLRAELPDRRRRKPGLRIERPTIARLCSLWQAAKVSAEPTSAHYAAEVVIKAKAIAERAGILDIDQATGAAVRALREASPRGIDRPLAYLRAVVAWAADELGLDVDQRFYVASRPPQSKESEARLMTQEEAAAIEQRARDLDQWPLVHCLMLYGWRPITACRITAGDVDLVAGRVRLQVKHHRLAHYHPLFPQTVDLLRPLLAGRAPGDRLFLSPSGIAWPCYGDEAKRLVSWYGERVKYLAPGTGGTNGLKRWALHRMERGLPPWPRALTLREIRLFTGHSTDSQVVRYRRVSASEAEALVRSGSVVGLPKPGATSGNLPSAIHADSAITPDESVSFSTKRNRV